jgi:pyridinium-3,5-biscarboxylic acid mononucleotide sulfurtransferase
MNAHEANLKDKHSRLTALLTSMERVLVAFSGGVDSTLLLKVAVDALGDDVLAVTAISQLSSQQEKKDAAEMAKRIGAAHVVVECDDLNDPVFVANPRDKCYHCKKRRFAMLKEMARDKGFAVVVDGTNYDDSADYRPGLKASQELGIRSPLSEAGLTKAQIRELSHRLGLPTWDKPAFACLASRIPYGDEITDQKLRQIDEGEIFLRDLGICRQVRVRHHGSVARLEVPPEAIGEFMVAAVRRRIADHFKQLGFQFVALDMDGYVMGSLNRALSFNQKERDAHG